MIELRYFASLRERLGRDQELVDAGAATVAELRARLRQRGGVWAEVLSDDQPLLCAVNQTLSRPETPISDGDEVAFFPPVTGG